MKRRENFLIRLALRMHRHAIPRMQAFWFSRWGEASFLVPLALLIGAVMALAASLLHVGVVKLEEAAFILGEIPRSRSEYLFYLVLLVLPLAGISASFLVQRYLGGQRYAKSLSPLILSLHRKRTNIPWRDCYTHMLSSALSVGFGGSAGLEAPSVLTGAAIGAAGNKIFRVARARKTMLIACGAAAAVSAIFDSPVAGVLFAAEVLLPQISVSSLVPMIMSSAVAAVVSRMIIADTQFIIAVTDDWRTEAVPFYFILGLVCAFVGSYIIKGAYFTAGILRKKFPSAWKRLFAGGAVLCVLLWLFPILRGQGYLYIGKLFSGELDGVVHSSFLLDLLPLNDAALLTIIVLAVLVLKVVVSSLTVDSGGDGGIFAPSMFIGAFTGFAFARVVNLTGIVELQEYNFVAVGMCGVFTAVMRAPLTGIFLIAEVTGSYILLVPLMIVSSISFLAARLFEKHSIYRKALEESNLLGSDRDQEFLRQMAVRGNIRREYHALAKTEPFSKVTELLANTRESDFPVLDGDGMLVGIVKLSDIRPAMMNTDVRELLLVFDVMSEPVGCVRPDDDLAQAMAQFDLLKTDILPVCTADGHFEGFIEKGPVFARYRSQVSEESGL